MAFLRSIFILSIASQLAALPPTHSNDDFDDDDAPQNTVGLASANASVEALGASMTGWGVGIAGGIAALTLLVPRSTGDEAHAH